MTSHIDFGVWAPDQAIFWQSWVDAGICTEPGVFADRYAGIECSALMGWTGVIVRTPAEIDGNGDVVKAAVLAPGWHCNVRVTGDILEAFTVNLPQTDENGLPLSIWERTWAAYVFQLAEQPADPATGFPAGYRGALGVTYADMSDFKSPACVRQ